MSLLFSGNRKALGWEVPGYRSLELNPSMYLSILLLGFLYHDSMSLMIWKPHMLHNCVCPPVSLSSSDWLLYTFYRRVWNTLSACVTMVAEQPMGTEGWPRFSVLTAWPSPSAPVAWAATGPTRPEDRYHRYCTTGTQRHTHFHYMSDISRLPHSHKM